MEISFTTLAIVAAAGFTAPPLLGLVPQLPLPSVVLEIVLGIVIGPPVLDWAKADEPVTIMALIGLSFLLLIAGLEVDYDRLRGRLLEVTGLGFLLSFGIGLPAGSGLDASGIVHAPLLIVIMFSAIGLGIVIGGFHGRNKYLPQRGIGFAASCAAAGPEGPRRRICGGHWPPDSRTADDPKSLWGFSRMAERTSSVMLFTYPYPPVGW